MDVIEKIGELVDLCKTMHSALMFSDANQENCSYAISLSNIILLKIEDVQKQIYR